MSLPERIFSMCSIIQAGQYPSVQTFREMFEVSERTVHGDLAYLKDRLRMDLKFDKARKGYYNADPNWKMPPIDLTDGEVFALILGKEMLSQYAGTSFEPVLRGAIEKIASRLSDKVEVDLSQVQSVVQFHTNGVIPISRKLLLDLTEACEMQRAVDLTYSAASTGERTKRTVHPYRIIENRGCWYLVAYCELRNDLRHFALHRIEEHTVSDSKYPLNESLDIDNWLKSAFQLEHGDGEHTVRIDFKPAAARYIRERHWHPSQQLDEHEDGSCTMTFIASNLDEVKRWVLPYGAEAQVIEPDVLRNKVRDELIAAANNYVDTRIIDMNLSRANRTRESSTGANSTGTNSTRANSTRTKPAARGIKRKTGVRSQLELDLDDTLQANEERTRQLKLELSSEES